ncbi:MAG: hypothetical protein C5B51_29595 [Terriglobia bacterium]|nr:MAG: hypothetical protein C5B51_29595 [Terriglobia bacterium]
MRKVADPSTRNAAAALAMAAVCMAVGCSSDPDPPSQPEELSPIVASTLISQKWSHDELNHLTVTLHSDTLIGCGVHNDLWKRVEIPYQGFTVNTYQLTETGRKVLFAIDLKDSGKFHEVTLQGPYLVQVTGITPGSEADSRQVAIHWEIDWNKAPASLTACLPRFELSGSQVGLFKLSGQQWSFISLLKPADVTAPTQAADPSLPSIIHP